VTSWPVTTEDDFLRCYDETLSELHRYASRLVGGDRSRAEDLVQETYVLLLRRAQAGEIGEVGIGWLTVALRHRFLDGLRSAGREQRRLRLAWSRPADDQVEARAAALDPLAGTGLTDRERAALTLRYVDDLTVAAVATELGLSTAATESLLARARRRARREVRGA
jgi:RNA polymerase sigma-70 factor (ECF subfamily)